MRSLRDIWFSTKQKMEELLTDSLKESFSKAKMKVVSHNLMIISKKIKKILIPVKNKISFFYPLPTKMQNHRYPNLIIAREKQMKTAIKVVYFLDKVVSSINLFLLNVLNKNKDFTPFIINLEKLRLKNGLIIADCHTNTKRMKYKD